MKYILSLILLFSAVYIKAQTGWMDPTATGEDYNQWTTPINAYSNNNVRAYALYSTLPASQDYYNFNFSIPVDAVIVGIGVSGEIYSNNALPYYAYIKADLSYDGGTTYTTVGYADSTSTQFTDEGFLLGSSSNLWGRVSWSISDFSNANFRLRLTFIDRFGNRPYTSDLDHVQVQIYYSSTSGINNYYFDSENGNDNGYGTEVSPFKSISKLKTLSLVSGDTVFFKCGSVWDTVGYSLDGVSGSFGSPIVFTHYGSGEFPKFTGYKNLTGFTQNGNYWSKTDEDLPDSKENYVGLPYITYTYFTPSIKIDGIKHEIGRYPNNSYLNAESVDASTNTYIIDNDASWTTNIWTNAQAVIGHADWITTKATITSNTNTRINITASDICTTCTGGYGLKATSGLSKTKFYFINDSNTLDINGEYYIDYLHKRILIYNTTPFTNVKVPVMDTIFSFNNCEHIKIKGLEFEGAVVNALKFTGGTNIEVENIKVSQSGFSNILVNDVDSFSTYNFVDLSQAGNGLVVYSSTNPSIKGLYSHSIGTDPSLYDRDSFWGNGLLMPYRKVNAEVLENRFDSCGYNAMHFKSNSSSGILVKDNLIEHTNIHKTDGGGIYFAEDTYNTNKIIRKNTIRYSADASEFLWGANVVRGIYLDNGSSYFLVDSNTVVGYPAGSFNHWSCNYNTLRNNLFVKFNVSSAFEYWRGGMYLEAASTSVPSFHDHTYKKNTVVVTDDDGSTAYNWNNPVGSYACTNCTVDSNYYHNPFRTDGKIFRQRVYWSNGSLYTLAEWRILTGLEVHTTYNQSSLMYSGVSGITENDFVHVFSNWSNQSHYFDLGDCSFKDLEVVPNTYSDSIQVSPRESIVLVYSSGNLSTVEESLYIQNIIPDYQDPETPSIPSTPIVYHNKVIIYIKR